MPQGTPAKAERLGSRARVISPGRQEPSLPAPPTLGQHAVCGAAAAEGRRLPPRSGEALSLSLFVGFYL